MTVLDQALATLSRTQPKKITGRVTMVRGLTVHATDLPFPIGGLVCIIPRAVGTEPSFGEVVGCDADGTIVMLFNATRGLAPDDPIFGMQTAQTVAIGDSALGRIINGMGQPIDGGGPLRDTVSCQIAPDPIPALSRAPITKPLPTGIKAIDAITTVGTGQRLGIFAGPGVGKSTLLSCIAKNTAADVCVIALIGERGREVHEFLKNGLGPKGLEKSVVVVATSDESPLLRIRAALVACATAEFYRDQGLDVLFMMDSLTRYCQALRQQGLSIGEPPATKGYTPSVFSQLASLLERSGNVEGVGSVTGFYTVLVEGDDMAEPISDASRAILDGHLSLTRKLANRGHYPAVDVLDSVSRVANDICDQTHIQSKLQVIRLLSLYNEVEELVNIGAYARGSNPEYDVAIDFIPKINALLKQAPSEQCSYPDTLQQLTQIALESGQAFANKMAASNIAANAGAA